MISHEYGVIMVHVPFSGTDVFEDCYIRNNHEHCISSFDTRKLPKNEPLEGHSLGKTINQFYDYELFSVVKSPYLRAYEMWKKNQSKLKKLKIQKQDIGEYFENLLNGQNCADGDKIKLQVDYLKSKNNSYFGYDNVDFEVNNLFHYETLMDNDFNEINEFLNNNGLNQLTYYVEPELNEKWREQYDKNSIEIINYIFEEDFDYCGYRKI